MNSIETVLKYVNDNLGKSAYDFGFNTEWCALFITKSLAYAGYTKLFGPATYSCTAQMGYWKGTGVWHDGYEGLTTPCIIYYDWDNTGDCDHVGIAIRKMSDSFVETIEGNTDGGLWGDTIVSKKTRGLNGMIRGYVPLSEIFPTDVPLNTPVYYGKSYTRTDNAGKCQLIQHMLNVVNNAGLTEDGIIGDNTDIAIKEFQSKHNLEIDGVVGDETLFKLTQLYFNIPLDNFKI